MRCFGLFMSLARIETLSTRRDGLLLMSRVCMVLLFLVESNPHVLFDSNYVRFPILRARCCIRGCSCSLQTTEAPLLGWARSR